MEIILNTYGDSAYRNGIEVYSKGRLYYYEMITECITHCTFSKDTYIHNLDVKKLIQLRSQYVK